MKSDSDEKPISFNEPVYVVCEGPADACLVRRLLKHHSISGCEVREAKGNQRFTSHLLGVATSSDRPKLRRLVVIADNDLNPTDRFTNVQNALRTAGFVVPSTASVIESGDPSVTTFMVPTFGMVGTLETLLVEAIFTNDANLKRCLEETCTCAGKVDGWDKVKRAKMFFQAAVAFRCADDPSAGAAHVWSKTHNPVPIDSQVFDELTQFLRVAASI